MTVPGVHITRPVLMTVFTAYALGTGLNWLLEPDRVSAAQPSLTDLRMVGATFDPGHPMVPWGIAFLALGVVKLLVLADPRRVRLGKAVLLTGMGLTTFYAMVLVFTAAHGLATWGGPVVYGSMAALHGVAANSLRR